MCIYSPKSQYSVLKDFILPTFDFKICQVGYNGRDVYVASLEDLITCRTTVDFRLLKIKKHIKHAPEVTIRAWNRLAKYSQRGFRITVILKDGGQVVMGPTP